MYVFLVSCVHLQLNWFSGRGADGASCFVLRLYRVACFKIHITPLIEVLRAFEKRVVKAHVTPVQPCVYLSRTIHYMDTFNSNHMNTSYPSQDSCFYCFGLFCVLAFSYRTLCITLLVFHCLASLHMHDILGNFRTCVCLYACVLTGLSMNLLH